MTTPPTEEKPLRVLLIDDDEDDFILTKALLKEIPDRTYELEWISDPDEGLEAICLGEHDVFLVDYLLGARTGLELLAEAKARDCNAPVILLTGQGEWAIDRAAMLAGASDYLEKTRLDPTLLERALRHALQKKRYEAELERQVIERTQALAETNRALEREIAERQKAEEALREADRRKDVFLATLAHELRTPLVPIRNALEILRLAGDNPALIERSRGLLERQVAQMVRLIDDLLDVSRITHGKLRVEKGLVELADVAESALEAARPTIERAQLALQTSLPEGSLRVVGDPVRLAQVVCNLLHNAAKYTDEGGTISLGIAREGDHAVIRIRDNGVGIPPDHIPRLFELFTQVDRTLPQAQGGLGIGLALVRHIVSLHDGSVEAASAGVGLGSEFVVRLSAADE